MIIKQAAWQRFLGATLLSATAACGGGGSGDTTEPDAADVPAPDADTTPDAAVPGEVTFTIGADVFGPDGLEGHPVLYFDPDGRLAAETTTDADGVATGEVLAGGTVVALITPPILPALGGGGPGQRFALSHHGVVPGDELELVVNQTSSPSRTVDVTVPTSAGATDYNLVVGCDQAFQQSGASTTFSLSNQNCPSPTWAAAFATSGDELVALLDDDVALTADVSLGGAYQALDDVEVTVTGLSPAATSEVAVQPVYRSVPLSYNTAGTGDSGVEELTVDAAMASLGNDPHLLVTAQQNRDGFFPKTAFVSQAFDDDALSVEVPALPWFTPPLFDAKEMALRWVESGDGEANFAFSFMQFNGPDATVLWYIADGAPAHGEYQVPDLPSDYAAYLPAAGSPVNASVLLFNVDEAKREAARRNVVYIVGGSGEQLLPGKGGHTAVSGQFGL